MRTWFQRLLARMRPRMFSAQRYWERRHQRLRGSLRTVGHIQLDERANAEQYEVKRTHITQMIRRHVDAPDERSLLDAGCGVGVLTEAYVKMGFDVVGVDFSAGAIQQARLRSVNARFLVQPLERLNLGRTFDVVTVIDALLHVVDDAHWVSALESIHRHLNPEGVLFILDWLNGDEEAPPTAHVKPRPLAQYEKCLGGFGLTLIDHERFTLAHEGATKDLLVFRHARIDESSDPRP